MQDRTVPLEKRQLVSLVLLACVGAFLYSYLWSILDVADIVRTGLVSDVNAYQDIADAVIAGGLPYIDVPVEHLPVSTLMIIVLGWVSSVTGIGIWLVWPAVMTGCVVATAIANDRVDPGRDRGRIFLIASTPLLPLVLFRLEPWVVLLAAAALATYAGGRTVGGSLLTFLGAMAKGWPVVAAAMPYRTGRRAAALLTATASLVGVAAMFAVEGFRSGRTFDGIHAETIIGSAAIMFRHLAGNPIGMESTAGAIYVDVPSAAVVGNLAIGLIVIAVGLIGVARRSTAASLMSPIGVIVLGIILASPLFSTQFLFWVAPFIAFAGMRQRWLYFGACVAALASVTIYEPTSMLWAAAVVAKNGLVVALAITWCRRTLTHQTMTHARSAEPL